jgi:hypothetical protein
LEGRGGRMKTRLEIKQIAREYFQENVDNVSTGTEGFPDTSSFIYGFVDGYDKAQKESEEKIKKLREALENLQGYVSASLLFPHKDRVDVFKAEQLARQVLKEIE